MDRHQSPLLGAQVNQVDRDVGHILANRITLAAHLAATDLQDGLKCQVKDPYLAKDG